MYLHTVGKGGAASVIGWCGFDAIALQNPRGLTRTKKKSQGDPVRICECARKKNAEEKQPPLRIFYLVRPVLRAYEYTYDAPPTVQTFHARWLPPLLLVLILLVVG